MSALLPSPHASSDDEGCDAAYLISTQVKKRKVDWSAADHCKTSPLVELIYITDIWHVVCSSLDGDTLTDLASVDPFRTPTQSSPAFVFLAGLRNDAVLVPWNDEFNCLSSKYYVGETAMWNREIAAIKAAECMCQYVVYPHYRLRHYRKHPLPYIRSGPARPPSPVHKPGDTTDVDYDPYLHTWNSSLHLNPPVFFRSQITYAPYWKALVYSSDGSHQSDYDNEY